MTHENSLLEHHRRLIEESAINADVAEARGYRSVTTKAELRTLGFGEKQSRVPALLIPIYNAAGEIANYQIRPDQPRVNERCKAVKYETPAKSHMVLDIPPLARKWIGDPGRPLFVTEGVRKADSAVSRGLCCVALLGVWNWRGSNDLGGKVALPDWEQVHLKGRQTYIGFDSDVVLKPAVHTAMERLKAFLESRGAKVALIYLPPCEDGSKVGLDDYFAAGHSVEELLTHASSELRPLPREDDSPADSCYIVTERGLVWKKPVGDGVAHIPLTNFTARIARQIAEDDGTETTRLFEIEAALGQRAVRFRVAGSRFSNLEWALEHLGANAVVYPGFGLRDHARAAIQELSGDVPEGRVYTHTGWRQIDDEWVYLHTGGGIGTEGVVEGVEVRLPDPLRLYRLPDPPGREELVQSVQASMRLMDLLADPLSAPLYAAIWLAPVGCADLSVYLTGPTGAGKTAVAALIQQHFGPQMDSGHLPGSWSSTSNALEGIGFAAKDTLLVVDDFAPGGPVSDAARMHREADRVFRAQANRSARQRMGPDASLRPAKPPRGLILATGEDVPRGESVRARLFVVEMEPNSLDWTKLQECQNEADSGTYARAMSGYLKWLAPRYADLRRDLQSKVEQLRRLCKSSAYHKRTPTNTAKLALGAELFLSYAVDVGAQTRDEAVRTRKRLLAALAAAASSQARHTAASEPARRFIELVRAAVSSGKAHIASTNGDTPQNPGTWGWRSISLGSGDRIVEEWRALGDRIGWNDGDDLYLEPEASYRAAVELSRSSPEPLSIAPRTLHKRLSERGCLVSVEQKRGTLTVRRTLDGSNRPVLHLRAGSVMPPATDNSDKPDNPDAPDEEQEEGSWQLHCQFPGAGPDDNDNPNAEDHVQESVDSSAVVGFVGSPESERPRTSEEPAGSEWSDGLPGRCSECGQSVRLVRHDAASSAQCWYYYGCDCGNWAYMKSSDYECWAQRKSRTEGR